MIALNDVIFSESGAVHDGIPHEREVIYVGRNGQKVERIQVRLDNQITSYIYKPLTNYPTMGKELWVQDHICSRIPKVDVPKIIDYSKAKEPESYWIVYEDLGELEHTFNSDIMKKTANVMPYWHLLPTSLVPDEFDGHSPRISEIQGFIQSKPMQLRKLFTTNGFSEDEMAYYCRSEWKTLHSRLGVHAYK